MAITSTANDGVESGLVLHGARAYITLDGEPVGYVQSLTGGEEYQLEPIEVLDFLPVAEFVPVAYRITLSATFVMLSGVSYKEQRLFSPVSQALSAEGLELIVVDNVSNEPIITFSGVKGQATNFTITKAQVTLNNVTFVAQTAKDHRNEV